MSYDIGFAPYYDRLNCDMDYRAWGEDIGGILRRHGISGGLALDLACGTGELTCELSRLGYDMIGIDSSCAMLDIAQRKARERGQDILFIEQDMTSFELYGTVRAAICALDSVNYLTDKRSLLRCFKNVMLYLEPGGVFIFDVNTEYKYEKILAQNSFVYDMGDLFCTWVNCYDRISRLCRFDITVFKGDETGAFRRFDESHLERMYTTQELVSLAGRAGFGKVGVYADLKLKRPKKNSERLFFVCEKES